MKFGIKTIDEFEIYGKTVLCRVDINEPINHENGTLNDITRIEACLPTIQELSEKGAKLVLLAHQGSDIEYKNFYFTKPHAEVLSKLLNSEVMWIDDVCGPAAREKIKSLNNGEILLLDNVRFMSEEQTLFELKLTLSHEEQAKTEVVKKLAPLADLYVGDAFAAAHRDQPSLCGFPQVLPSAMGRLFEKEFSVISELMTAPERPCVFVLGGAKVADAFLMMESVLEIGAADYILTGGLVSQILLEANGISIGKKNLDFVIKKNFAEFIESSKSIYEKYKDKIILPTDSAYVIDGVRQECSVHEVTDEISVGDIGSNSAKMFADYIKNAKTVFVNGPLGIFEEEPTELGTKAVWDALKTTKAYTVVGGGDSITATKKYGATEDISYICTGGGALIQFLTGKELPVVKALRTAAKREGLA